jgi:phospholipid/cholesterol/gamma-HCH transport system substrate-binding protein
VHVNTDEVIAMLDVDTRDYLRTLLDAGGQGLKDRGPDLRALLKLSEPTFRQTERVVSAVAERRQMMRTLVSNLRKLSEATAAKDTELAGLVDAAGTTFQALGEREAELTEATERLPGTLAAARGALADGRELVDAAGPALEALRPAARRLGPALVAAQPLLREAHPIVRDDLRPLVREAIPLFKQLRPTLRDLNRVTPRLVRVGRVLNYLGNELGYNPPGSEEGYLFWLSWFAHNAHSTVTVDDAHGPVVRGLAQFSCSNLGTIGGAVPLAPIIAALGVCP